MMPGNVLNRFAAVVLAAGKSLRFGPDNKLHTPIDGVPMIEQVLRLVSSLEFDQQIVVASPADLRMAEVAKRHQFNIAFNENEGDAISKSVANGVRGLNQDELTGIAIFLGDMPFLSPRTIASVTKQFLRCNAHRIVRPQIGNQPGHPVMFPVSMVDHLLNLTGDQGANTIMQRHPELVVTVEDSDGGAVSDIDCQSDLEKDDLCLTKLLYPWGESSR